jgi:DNA polymerase-1
VAVDTETSSLDPLRADLVGISLCHEDDPGRPWYIPLAHDEQSEEQREALRLAVDRILGPMLNDPGIEKCGHNLKYDLLVLERAGLPLAGIAFDSMVASYVLNPERHRHSLSAISQEVLGIVPEAYTDVTGKGKQQKPFAAVPVADAARYSGADALLAWRLQRELKRQLAEKPRLAELFATIEMPLVEVLARMEAAGVRIDVGHLERLRADYGRRLENLAAEIYAAAGVEFNINSSRQLGEVLFDRLNLPVLKKTKTGASTNVEVLTELAAQHPLPGMVLAWRSLTKLTSTYIEALPRLVHPETGRVHTSYNQTVTATGRLSSSDPNLQNIPIRGEDGSDIRRAFIVRDGWKMLAADYSQIELRILAHLSGDAELTAAFARGDDIHTLTAARLFGVLPLMVTADMRREAKVVNFGVLYGMSAFGLAKELKIDRTQAKAYIDSYFATYTGVREYFDRIIAKGERRGYVETMFGRRRYLPDLTSRNPARREAARRAAVNSPIQGTAADIIKRAMITIDRRRREEGWRAVMIMQVHDELVFEVPPEELQPLRDLVRAEMGGAAALEIPLVVDIGVGDNWLEAH